jgi:G protein-coupled receptor 157
MGKNADALTAVGITSATLSIIGSALIIASYILWHDLRTTTRKLLVYLSICDLITAIFNFIGLVTSQSRFV